VTITLYVLYYKVCGKTGMIAASECPWKKIIFDSKMH